MNFYENPNNIDEYIKMCQEYDGLHIYQELYKFLDYGKTILELGSGPGFDLDFLKKHYRITGSDNSNEFLSRLRNKYKNITFHQINAVNINIDEKFDCIFSNKVLHHLTENELYESLMNQKKNLNSDGIIAHTFWIGAENQEIEGLLFMYYQMDDIKSIISKEYNILSVLNYTEFEEGDSLFIIGKPKL